jgi:P-type Ca2+ transporter type 2C
MGHALAVRSVNKLVVEINPFSNPLLLWAILGTILLQLAVVYIAPLRWRSLP